MSNGSLEMSQSCVPGQQFTLLPERRRLMELGLERLRLAVLPQQQGLEQKRVHGPELKLRMLHRRIRMNHHMNCNSHTMAGMLVRSRPACSRLALVCGISV